MTIIVAKKVRVDHEEKEINFFTQYWVVLLRRSIKVKF